MWTTHVMHVHADHFRARVLEGTARDGRPSQIYMCCMYVQIIFAREFLREVRMKADQVKYIVTNARNGMCQGHRAELFAVRAAKACAALAVSSHSNTNHAASRFLVHHFIFRMKDEHKVKMFI